MLKIIPVVYPRQSVRLNLTGFFLMSSSFFDNSLSLSLQLDSICDECYPAIKVKAFSIILKIKIQNEIN